MNAKKTAPKFSKAKAARALRKTLQLPAPTSREWQEGALFGLNMWADEHLPAFSPLQLRHLLGRVVKEIQGRPKANGRPVKLNASGKQRAAGFYKLMLDLGLSRSESIELLARIEGASIKTIERAITGARRSSS